MMLRGALALTLALGLAAAQAQNYPTHPVKVVVPYAVGGSADIYGRVLAAKLSEAMGQAFVIENRPGGGAVLGTDAVAKSAPDGYTVLVMSNTHTVNETLIPKKPYDLMRDLAPVSGINSQDLLLVGSPNLKASNLKELIAAAKKEPGKLNYASSGPGTPYHMAGELFKHMAGLDIVHIPHKGSDQARTAVLGSQVDLMFDAISTIVGQVHAGKLKALGTTGQHRSAVTPEIPTIAEAGPTARRIRWKAWTRSSTCRWRRRGRARRTSRRSSSATSSRRGPGSSYRSFPLAWRAASCRSRGRRCSPSTPPPAPAVHQAARPPARPPRSARKMRPLARRTARRNREKRPSGCCPSRSIGRSA